MIFMIQWAIISVSFTLASSQEHLFIMQEEIIENQILGVGEFVWAWFTHILLRLFKVLN